MICSTEAPRAGWCSYRRGVVACAVMLAVVVLTACGDESAVGTHAPPDPAPSDNQHFIFDETGRVLILHGTNVDLWSKNDPAYLGGIERSDIALMAAPLGFNASRHLLFWEAIEPQPGVFNEAYLDEVGHRLDWYAEQGIHVILDMHQDCPPSTAFRPSADYTEYDGAPAWAARVDNVPYTPSGNQMRDCFSRAVDHYLRAFWDPATVHPEFQDHYRRALARVVERFHQHPAVLGYDVMNEPLLWIQESENILTMATAGHAEDPILTTFMQRLIDTVRAIDADHYVFVEAMAIVANPGLPGDLGVLHDPRTGLPRIVYAPHMYEANTSSPSSDPASQYAFLARWSAARDADSAVQHLPQVLGEFGVPYTGYLDMILDLADQRMSGWVQWAFSGHFAVVDRRRNETALTDHYVRPYPRAIAGIPISFGWDVEGQVLRLTYTGRAGVDAPTELFLPQRHFPDGFRVFASGVEDPGSVCWEPSRSILKLRGSDPSTTYRVCVADASQSLPPVGCPDSQLAAAGQASQAVALPP